MKKITLLIWAIFIIIQNTFGWDWPQNRNTNGGTPEQPTTIYLGDQGSFGHDSWAALNDKTPKWQVVISTNADLSTNALYGDWSAYNKYEHKTALSPHFTSTGTWYWGMKVEYTDAGNTTAWYCKNVGIWENMYGTPTSNLTITVSELGEPISQSATSESSSSINLSWNKWEGRNVMILRKRSTDSWTEPTQGTPYSTGTSLGQGIVIYNGGLTAFTDIGLEPGVTYDYKYYSENYSYYSTGVTAQATTDNTSATDNFRSKITGNWNTASN